jgi:hypothetical protein
MFGLIRGALALVMPIRQMSIKAVSSKVVETQDISEEALRKALHALGASATHVEDKSTYFTIPNFDACVMVRRSEYDKFSIHCESSNFMPHLVAELQKIPEDTLMMGCADQATS